MSERNILILSILICFSGYEIASAKNFMLVSLSDKAEILYSKNEDTVVHTALSLLQKDIKILVTKMFRYLCKILRKEEI